MKRTFVFVMLLCLVLAGCGLSPVPETSPEAPSLPVPEQPDKAALTETFYVFTEPDIPNDPEVPGDPDVVTVHQEAIPTRIENEERWEGFLAAVELGEENGLTLRLIYEGGVYDLDLRYDGEVYILVDEGHVTTCKYLLVEEEDTPRPGAKYRRAVHYILSDDPDLTWEQYMARMASSSVLFDQAAARSLFSVFDS